MTEISWIGLKELQAAIKRNPQTVLNEGRDFLSRGLAVYKSGIVNSPWRISGSGGGSPVSNDPRYPRRYQRLRSGNLRDTHVTSISGLQATIGPNLQAAPYAKYVHGGTRRMHGRPWLEFVKESKMQEIEKLYRVMLGRITSDLAK